MSMPSEAVVARPVPEESGSISAPTSASAMRAAARQTAARASLETVLRASSATASASASTSVACSRSLASESLRSLMSCISVCSSVSPSTSIMVRASSTGKRRSVLCQRLAIDPCLRPARVRDSRQSPREQGVEVGPILGRDDQLRQPPPQRLGGRPAEGPLRRAVPGLHQALAVGRDVGFVHRIEDQLPLRPLQRELPLRPALLADVLEHRDPADDLLALPDRRGADHVEGARRLGAVLEDPILAPDRRPVVLEQLVGRRRRRQDVPDQLPDDGHLGSAPDGLAEREVDPQLPVEADDGAVRHLIEQSPIATLAPPHPQVGDGRAAAAPSAISSAMAKTSRPSSACRIQPSPRTPNPATHEPDPSAHSIGRDRSGLDLCRGRQTPKAPGPKAPDSVGEDDPLDRVEVGLAADHRRRLAERRVRDP